MHMRPKERTSNTISGDQIMHALHFGLGCRCCCHRLCCALIRPFPCGLRLLALPLRLPSPLTCARMASLSHLFTFASPRSQARRCSPHDAAIMPVPLSPIEVALPVLLAFVATRRQIKALRSCRRKLTLLARESRRPRPICDARATDSCGRRRLRPRLVDAHALPVHRSRRRESCAPPVAAPDRGTH